MGAPASPSGGLSLLSSCPTGGGHGRSLMTLISTGWGMGRVWEKREKERERKALEKTINNTRGPQRTAVLGGEISGLNSWEPYLSLAISSPPQYQAETRLKWGTFPNGQTLLLHQFFQPTLSRVWGSLQSPCSTYPTVWGSWPSTPLPSVLPMHLFCPRYLPAPLPGSGLQPCASSSCPSAGVPWTP